MCPYIEDLPQEIIDLINSNNDLVRVNFEKEVIEFYSGTQQPTGSISFTAPADVISRVIKEHVKQS